MSGSVEGGEGFELIEGALLVKHLGVGLNGERCAEHAGGGDRRELARLRVRGRVGAEEVAGGAGRGRLAQRLPVALALDHGHAAEVQPEAETEPVGAVELEVMRRDGAGHLRRGRAHEFGADRRRQVLEHDLQAREVAQHRRKAALDEHRLAVEHVDLAAHLLAVDEKAHADPLHARQHRPDMGVVGDARRRVGGGMGRIELDGREHALAEAALDIIRVGLVGEIARHQRLEARARRQRRPDALAIGGGFSGRAHRRRQVRHNDGAAEMPRSYRQHGLEHGAVAHVQVPVVGPADGDALGHADGVIVRPARRHQFSQARSIV